MTKHCSSCGATSSAEARFCRLCGVPFNSARAGDGHNSSSKSKRENEQHVSPLAATVPLADDGRATDSLALDDAGGGRVQETSKVSRAEMDEMLRRPLSQTTPQREPERDARAPGSTQSKTPSSEPPALVPSPTTVLDSTPALPQTSGTTDKAVVQNSASRKWLKVGGSFLIVALIASLIAVLYAWRKRTPDAPISAQANASSDERAAIDAQLSDAQTRLASGDTDGAIMRLREVLKIDETNALAHTRLGEALDKSGAREEAINEYLAALRLNDQDALAWRALAQDQFSIGRFDESADSYHRLSMLAKGDAYSDDARLEHAAALQNTGRTEEARTLLLKLASESTDSETRLAAQRRLAESAASPSPALANANSDLKELPRNERANASREVKLRQPITTNNAPASNASPAPSPPSTATRAPFVASPPVKSNAGKTNVTAANDPDAFYIKGLSVLNTRNPKTLQRAEVVTALGYFQRAAQPGGTHRREAQKLAERLGKELDKFREADKHRAVKR